MTELLLIGFRKVALATGKANLPISGFFPKGHYAYFRVYYSFPKPTHWLILFIELTGERKLFLKKEQS